MNGSAKTEAWIERLRGMGFTNYEARVYIALLGEQSLPVADIVRKSGVPQPKVYEATRALTERGFVERMLGDVQAFTAVPPTRAFELHRDRQQAELARQAEEMKALQAAAPKAPQISADTWGVRIVQGTANVRETRADFARNTKEELVQLIKPPIWAGATPHKVLTMHKPKFRIVRLLEESLFSLPEVGEAFEMMAATEEHTRVVPSLPMKASIYDRKTIVFPLQDRDDGALIVIPQPDLAANWARWAIDLWENTQPYGAKSGKRKSPARKA